MNSTSIYYILCRKETKLFVICTVTGGLLQIICRRYIENNPEFLEEPKITIEIENPSGEIEQITNKITKEPIIRRIIKRLRGSGKIPEKLLEIFLRMMLKKLIKLMAKKGVELGISFGATLILAITPKKALAKIIAGSLPQNLLNKKSFTIINGEKIYLENCDNSFKYMVSILMDKEVPYAEKKELVEYVFRVNLDQSNLVLCLIPIILILSTQNPASYFLLLKNLIKALKEGRLSKKIARILVRKLLKQGTLVDPELMDLIEE